MRVKTEYVKHFDLILNQRYSDLNYQIGLLVMFFFFFFYYFLVDQRIHSNMLTTSNYSEVIVNIIVASVSNSI